MHRTSVKCVRGGVRAFCDNCNWSAAEVRDDPHDAEQDGFAHENNREPIRKNDTVSSHSYELNMVSAAIWPDSIYWGRF